MWINCRGLHGVDLLGDFHGAELSAYASAYTPTDDQSRNDRSTLLDYGKHNDSREERLRSKSSILFRRPSRQWSSASSSDWFPVFRECEHGEAQKVWEGRRPVRSCSRRCLLSSLMFCWCD